MEAIYSRFTLTAVPVAKGMVVKPVVDVSSVLCVLQLVLLPSLYLHKI